MRIDLPDGEWAEFCAPKKVSDRRRRAFIAAMNDATAATAELPQLPNPNMPGQTMPDPRYMTGEQNELQFHAFDLLVMCFVKAWSFPQDPSLETVEDLETGAKDVLVAKALGLMTDLLPDYSEDIDPKALTSRSTGLPPGSSGVDGSTYATLSSGTTS